MLQHNQDGPMKTGFVIGTRGMEGLFRMYQPTPGLLANQWEGFELVMIEPKSNMPTTMMAPHFELSGSGDYF